MKRALIIIAIILGACTRVGEYQADGSFEEGLLGQIKPKGWILEALMRQRDGLSGHPEALSYPYNSCLWAGVIDRQATHGEDWWRYEQTAYYTDGVMKLGYLIGDDTLTRKGIKGVRYTLEGQSSDGLLGVDASRSKERMARVMWPQAVFFRSMKTWYEMTGDKRVPSALEKYFLHYGADVIGLGRNVVNVEGMVWTWHHTGNRDLLDLACKAYLEGDYETKPSLLESGRPLNVHGVTFCEELKLPIILWEATRDSTFLHMAHKLHDNLVVYNMLPDGVPTSAEWVKGKDMTAAHETCDIADFTWSEGYYLMTLCDASYADAIERAVFNAAPGAVTKDFRSLQYFSNLNQFNVTGDSDHNEYRRGLTWMAYRPTHETECCAGNVHRILPNYVSRMWLTSQDGGIVAAMYGPSSVDFRGLVINEETSYPFGDSISFRFEGRTRKVPFTLRIPAWAAGYTIVLNGRRLKSNVPAGKFITIERRWKKGDNLIISFTERAEIVDAEGQGGYVQRGPLLYAYAIPQTLTEDTREYPQLNGKRSQNPDFKCWNITPSGSFNYALADSEVEEIAMGGTAFPYDSPPLGLKVNVKRIEWQLEEGRFTPSIPKVPKVQSDETESLTLIPYGCTELRLTVFPVIR